MKVTEVRSIIGHFGRDSQEKRDFNPHRTTEILSRFWLSCCGEAHWSRRLMFRSDGACGCALAPLWPLTTQYGRSMGGGW